MTAPPGVIGRNGDWFVPNERVGLLLNYRKTAIEINVHYLGVKWLTWPSIADLLQQPMQVISIEINPEPQAIIFIDELKIWCRIDPSLFCGDSQSSNLVISILPIDKMGTADLCFAEYIMATLTFFVNFLSHFKSPLQ